MEEVQKTDNLAPQTPPNVIRVEGATGDLRLHEFHSRIFRNTRFLRVWLPPGYDQDENSGRRYPVLYLNDGQNLFEASTSFTGVEWGVDETADRLIREKVIAPMIVVGIDNAGKDRFREYMPHRSLQPMMLRVQGRHYPTFLTKEVMPFMGRNYRVASGPENTGLGGSSLGALISLYTAAVRPGLIGRLLLESPSLWASNRQMIRESREIKDWPDRVFLATGTAEAGRADRDRSMVDDVRELGAIFGRAGLGTNRLRLFVDEGANHHESAWARRFPQALSFLFGSSHS
ncbi:MAG TPA: alpha/beta hydrolase-fold protein [Candidatus Sulfotelmatobacter sp.]|nr:alpha/beta hydrolase-fold protein [Candidatus Sulfotelmatobacter sp.]